MNNICNKRQIPVKKAYYSPPESPTFGEIVLFRKSKTNSICKICYDYHPFTDACKSKPEFPPSHYYPQCNICEGYHPQYKCYFEYMREVVFTYSPCERCKNQCHIGFCKSALICTTCETKHNHIDTCTRFALDTSDNLCPQCDFNHTLHCHQDLTTIEIDLILWCNRCKIRHKFMKCVPHCIRCNRRHREDLICPSKSDFCKFCKYSHHQSPCPYAKPVKPYKKKPDPILSPPQLMCPSDCQENCCKKIEP